MTDPGAETVRLAWHHLDVRVPAAWEVIGYKKTPGDGRLVLADRCGERLQAHWKIVSRRPQVALTLETFIATVPGIGLDRKAIRKQMLEIAGWDAFLPRDPAMPAFAARFHEPTRALLNFAFPPHADAAGRNAMRGVLESWQPNDGPERAWAALGLEITLPATLQLNDVTAYPACQVMRFEDRRGESVTVHRYGMMPLVLGGEDMATFFARVKGKKFLLRRAGPYLHEGRYEGVELHYSTRGRGGMFNSLLARTWQGRVWVWRRDDLKRLFAVDNHAIEKRLIPRLPERVHCR